MKIFQCGNCNHPLFFENYTCENCGHLSGYRHHDRTMLTFDPWVTPYIGYDDGISYKFCDNRALGVCNWVMKSEENESFCTACQLNGRLPIDRNGDQFNSWQSLEIAKHRLVYQLQKIGLRLVSKIRSVDGLSFDFVSKITEPKLMTGHDNGVITIMLEEADSVYREDMRQKMDEPYRTIIGHLRHEVGHYFWNRLIANDYEVLTNFRNLFGDDRADYQEALKFYYKNTTPVNWQKDFVSQYATSHPWEDWAETWAHYLHIMDMLETAYWFGMKVTPFDSKQGMNADAYFDPYTHINFEEIVKTCIAMTFAVNSINKSMGLQDIYPFVISDKVKEKMQFIHELLLNKRQMLMS